MNIQERKQLIESYGKASSLLKNALPKFPKEMWRWKPAPEKWSIHEIIIHLADSEVNSYLRCRRFIAEPGGGVYAYDENKWEKHLNYHEQDTDDALALFDLLRKTSFELIKKVPDETWETATIMHSENGLMRFTDWLKVYEEHIPVHIRQMERNLEAWKCLKA